MKYCSLFIILVVGLIATGCQTYRPQYRFELVETQSNDPQSYESLEKRKSLRFKISYQGIQEKAQGDQLPRKIINFKMKLTNIGSKEVIIRPREFALIDDESQRFPVNTTVSEKKTVQLMPQSITKLTLGFSLPRGYDMEKTGSFRLVWTYIVDGKEYRRVSKFIKQNIEYRYRGGYYHRWGFYPSWRFHYRFGKRHRYHCY